MSKYSHMFRPKRQLTASMPSDEFERLALFADSKRLAAIQSQRSFPSRRSAKHPTTGQRFLKTARIIAANNETLYTRPTDYRSVNPTSQSAYKAS